MVNWELIKISVLERSKFYSFANEEDFAKYLAQIYHYAVTTSAMSTRGQKLVRANSEMLEKMWIAAFKIGKTGNNVAIIENMKQLFNRGVYLYWQGAVFVPVPRIIPVNVVLNAGNPDVLSLYNTNDFEAFIKNLINNLKIYMQTIIGTGWVGVV